MAENQYPLDVEALVKGQAFSTGELEQLLGVKANDATKYRFAVLGLQELIQERTGFTVKANDDGLTVLTDAEAAEHNDKLFRQHLRGLGKRHGLAVEVDVSALTDDQRARHDRALIRNSRILQALQTETRKMRLEAASDSQDHPATRIEGPNPSKETEQQHE